jgi:hypothetical protein
VSCFPPRIGIRHIDASGSPSVFIGRLLERARDKHKSLPARMALRTGTLNRYPGQMMSKDELVDNAMIVSASSAVS